MSEKSKNILLGVLIVGLVSMTVAYAALSTTLTINGTANVAEAKWDIHFENWTEAKSQNGVSNVTNTAVTTATPTQTVASKVTLIDGLVVSLPQPGDTMTYTFDIVNDGTINAQLSSFTRRISAVDKNNTEANTNDLTYTVRCGDQATKPNSGAQTLTNPTTYTNETTGILLDSGKSIACDLTITYNTATNAHTAGTDQTYTGVERTVTLGADWIWVQK